MSFPQTHQTLIERIAIHNDDASWRQFLGDYWGPVCRFAVRRGHLQAHDAEDVAAQTFVALVQNRLLARWVSQRSARLRTLLCSVVRNVLANVMRVEQGRERLLHRQPCSTNDPSASPLAAPLEAPPDQLDIFYAAWVEDLLGQAVEALLTEYHQEGRGDYFRVLYGRLCDGMTAVEVADALGLTQSQAENAYKHARKRLAGRLEDLVRRHVQRYCPTEESEDAFTAEWGQLGEFLKRQGGLELAVQRAYQENAPLPDQRRAIDATLERLADHLRQETP
jgi:RNA polymerase sigma factor (sigma-70 family)